MGRRIHSRRAVASLGLFVLAFAAPARSVLATPQDLRVSMNPESTRDVIFAPTIRAAERRASTPAADDIDWGPLDDPEATTRASGEASRTRAAGWAMIAASLGIYSVGVVANGTSGSAEGMAIVGGIGGAILLAGSIVLISGASRYRPLDR